MKVKIMINNSTEHIANQCYSEKEKVQNIVFCIPRMFLQDLRITDILKAHSVSKSILTQALLFLRYLFSHLHVLP